MPTVVLRPACFWHSRCGGPCSLEGEAGVGKTEIAKTLARALDRSLVRLQCYEGLDTASAVYEWNYTRQMIEIRLAEAAPVAPAGPGAAAGSAEARARTFDREALAASIFTERFLIRRPILQALQPEDGVPPILLIDELDRTDEPFEAYLLEVLAEYQVTIPELGPIKAAEPPIVVITSMARARSTTPSSAGACITGSTIQARGARTRHRATQGAGRDSRLSAEMVAFTQRLRAMDLFKSPGIAETLDWSEALVALDRISLDPDTVANTLGALLKYQDDIGAITPQVAAQLVQHAQTEAAARV